LAFLTESGKASDWCLSVDAGDVLLQRRDRAAYSVDFTGQLY